MHLQQLLHTLQVVGRAPLPGTVLRPETRGIGKQSRMAPAQALVQLLL